jgi:hypothetical protein
MSRPLVAILACAALEAAGIALIFPVLPNLLRAMASTDKLSALYGTLLALHALTQFVVTPVLGALLVLAFAQASWIAFALIPLIAFGGISAPALRSLQSKAVDRARQGQLQGVVASFVSLAAIFGPLVFGGIYALSRPGWTGLVWIIGVAIFALAVPVVLTAPRSAGQRSL